MALAASMYWLSLITRALARTIRAPTGIMGTAMAMIRVAMERSRAASNARARMIRGNDIRISTIRWLMASVFPPQ